MMHMTLYWDTQVTLLFDSWTAASWPGYVVALLLCFVASVSYQRLESLRLRLESPPLIGRKMGRSRRVRACAAALFGVNSAVGYLIMLAVMSYNGGVLLTVALGFAVGYYAFRSEYFGDGDDYLAGGDDANACACS